MLTALARSRANFFVGILFCECSVHVVPSTLDAHYVPSADPRARALLGPKPKLIREHSIKTESPLNWHRVDEDLRPLSESLIRLNDKSHHN